SFDFGLQLDRTALSFLGSLPAEFPAQLAFFLFEFLAQLLSHLQFDVAVKRFIEREFVGTFGTGDFLIHGFGKSEEGYLFGDDVRMQNRLITDSFVERFKNDATRVRPGLKPSARRRLFRVGSLNVASFLQPLFEVRFIGKGYLSVPS